MWHLARSGLSWLLISDYTLWFRTSPLMMVPINFWWNSDLFKKKEHFSSSITEEVRAFLDKSIKFSIENPWKAYNDWSWPLNSITVDTKIHYCSPLGLKYTLPKILSPVWAVGGRECPHNVLPCLQYFIVVAQTADLHILGRWDFCLRNCWPFDGTFQQTAYFGSFD